MLLTFGEAISWMTFCSARHVEPTEFGISTEAILLVATSFRLTLQMKLRFLLRSGKDSGLENAKEVMTDGSAIFDIREKGKSTRGEKCGIANQSSSFCLDLLKCTLPFKQLESLTFAVLLSEATHNLKSIDDAFQCRLLC